MTSSLLLMGLFFLLAGVVQGMMGFGFGMISMSLLALIVDLQTAVPVVAVFCLLVQLLLLSQLWPSLSWKKLRLMVLGAVAGAPVGVHLLSTISPQNMLLVLGIFLILYALKHLISPPQSQASLSERWGLLAGLGGGVLGGALNTSGPPVLVYLSRQPWDKKEVAATLQAYFFFVTTTQLVMLYRAELLTKETLLLNAKLFLAVCIGVGLGFRIFSTINQETFKKWMAIGILIAGVSFVARSSGSL